MFGYQTVESISSPRASRLSDIQPLPAARRRYRGRRREHPQRTGLTVAPASNMARE